MRVAYEIDAADRIIGHDSGWDAFARANDAPELTELDGSIVLWGSIADETTVCCGGRCSIMFATPADRST